MQQYPNFLDPEDVRSGYHEYAFSKSPTGRCWGRGQTQWHYFSREEDLFWELRILGTSTQLSLRSVFYYSGKVFCLSGGDEHRQLKFSQLKHVSKGYIYMENGSKNRSGGVAQMKIENEVVPSYASTNAENKERCHVYLLNLYMEKVSKGALSKGAFYLRPVAKVSDILGSGLYINIQRLELYT